MKLLHFCRWRSACVFAGNSYFVPSSSSNIASIKLSWAAITCKHSVSRGVYSCVNIKLTNAYINCGYISKVPGLIACMECYNTQWRFWIGLLWQFWTKDRGNWFLDVLRNCGSTALSFLEEKLILIFQIIIIVVQKSTSRMWCPISLCFCAIWWRPWDQMEIQ